MASTINASTSAGLVNTADTSGVLQLQTANTTALSISATQKVGIGTTSVYGTSSPLSILGSPTAGQTALVISDGATATIGLALGTPSASTVPYLFSNVDLALGTNGAERMRIDSSGNLLVGITSQSGRFTVQASTADSSTNLVYGTNSSGTKLFQVRNDGAFNTGVAAVSPYNNTTGSGANLYVASDGFLARSTSSLKYKTNVQDAIHGLADVLKLHPVTYQSKAEQDAGKTFGGLIAEEVDAAGLKEFVQYAEDGTPDALSYGNMVALAFKAIQEQQALITNLTTRLAALEGAK